MLDKNELNKKGIAEKQKEENPLLSTLKRHYPHILQDGKISLKSLKESLAKALNLQDANELENMQNLGGYELNFTGKGLANALYNSECEKELKLDDIFELNAVNCHDNFNIKNEGEAEISSTQSIDKDSKAEFSSIQRVQDFGDKNGALQGEARELPNAVMTEAKPKQSPFLAQKTSPYAFKVNNMIIKGDNLDALKLLKSAYSGKIKMIYIDPPYNTQSDNFIYRDSFRDDYKAILREVGLIETLENGEEVESENLKFFKNITGSKTHSGWLCFMLPRLKLARDLLKEDGVIFISIDDNEQANLKLLCDEIFGEDNFIETFLWNKTQTPPSASNKTRKTHEFILCYQKNRDNQKMVARFASGGDAPLWNETNSERILTFPANYVFSNLSNGVYKKGIRDKIELLDDVNVENGKIINSFRLKGHFRWKQETLDSEILNNVYLVVKSDKFSIRYCREEERIVMPTNEISKKDGVGTNETASKEIEAIFNDKVFNFSKPTSLIKHLLKISSSANQNEQPDIILDFFAGSGTTAQAVMELNSEDKANREFILVQIPEPIDEKKSKTAFDFCKNELSVENPVISDITIERVKRAAKKIYEKMKINDEKDNKAENSSTQRVQDFGDKNGALQGEARELPNAVMTEAKPKQSPFLAQKTSQNFNFKVFSLKNKAKIITSDKNSLKIEDKSDLSPLDKALNLILQSGKSLNKDIKTIIENKLYECENAYFVVSLDKEVLAFLQDTKSEIYLNGFLLDDLEAFLNVGLKENITVIF